MRRTSISSSASSRTAPTSARIRSCSAALARGNGNTSSSWISPRNSDLANDETFCHSGASRVVVAASIAAGITRVRGVEPRRPSGRPGRPGLTLAGDHVAGVDVVLVELAKQQPDVVAGLRRVKDLAEGLDPVDLRRCVVDPHGVANAHRAVLDGSRRDEAAAADEEDVGDGQAEDAGKASAGSGTPSSCSWRSMAIWASGASAPRRATSETPVGRPVSGPTPLGSATTGRPVRFQWAVNAISGSDSP